MAAACPPGSRGCDSLFQLSPHMHARPKNSSYGNRGGPREAIEAKRGVVESQTDGAFAAPTFLSLHRLHLRSSVLLIGSRIGIRTFVMNHRSLAMVGYATQPLLGANSVKILIYQLAFLYNT